MRKQTKIAAVVSAAALLALGASITSFAASKGTWMMVDDEWYCYDKNGDVYTNTFCSSNGKEYYVGDDGAIVTSSWVDYDGEYYFVNSSGAKVTNDWRLTAPIDDENGDEQWFYFQSTGKRANNKKILYKGHTYYFDADGKMLTGWVTADGTDVVNEENSIDTDKTFYCDETGARVESGWIQTTEPATADDDADADEYWYYLKSSGKVATGKQNNVKGQTYIFGTETDNKGQMLTGWVGGNEDADKKMHYVEIGDEDNSRALSTTDAAYYAPYGDDFDGHVKKNQWALTWKPTEYHDEDEDNDKWYYWLDKDGKVFVPENGVYDALGYKYALGDAALEIKNGGNAYQITKKKINSKDYFFNEEGEMLSKFIDVQEIYKNPKTNSFAMDLGFYYLGGGSDGCMKTGAQSIKDDNGDVYKFYFGTKDNSTTGEKKGAGITGNKNNKLYYEGHLVAAEDYKYQPVWVNGHLFVVNQNGSIQHSAVEYKEDGDILIDMTALKGIKDAFVEKADTTYTVWDKYAVKDTYNNKVTFTVDELDPKKVMAFKDYSKVTPSSK